MWPAKNWKGGGGAAVLHLCINARTVDFGLKGERGVEWLEHGTVELSPTERSRFDALHELIQGLTQRLGGGGLHVKEMRVIVSDVWLAAASIPWSQSLLKEPAASAYVAQLLRATGCSMASGDVVKVNDAPFGSPRLAVAYPASLLAMLSTCAEKMGGRLISVRSFGDVLWQLSGAAGAAVVACLDKDEVLLLSGAVRLEGVVARLGPEDRPPDMGDLARLWSRQTLRASVSGCPRMLLLNLNRGVQGADAGAAMPCGVWAPWSVPLADQVPVRLQLAVQQTQSVKPLDAIPRAPGLSAAAVVLVTSVTAIALALSWSAWQYHVEGGRLAYEIEQRSRVAMARPSDRAPSKEQLLQLQAAKDAARQLDVPFHALLKALQPARDIQVAVLGVDFLGQDAEGRGRMSVVGEARTALDMTRYASFIEGRRPLGDVYLTHHELAGSASRTNYRFTVEVAWSK